MPEHVAIIKSLSREDLADAFFLIMKWPGDADGNGRMWPDIADESRTYQEQRNAVLADLRRNGKNLSARLHLRERQQCRKTGSTWSSRRTTARKK